MSHEAEFNRTKIEEAQERKAQLINRDSNEHEDNIQAKVYARRLIRADFDRSDITYGTKLDIIKHARNLGYCILADQMKADL